MTTHEKIADIIGYYTAALVSGNNQPDMSGDPRNRLHAHVRRRFDAACQEAAEKIIAELSALPGAVNGCIAARRALTGGKS